MPIGLEAVGPARQLTIEHKSGDNKGVLISDTVRLQGPPVLGL